jgi:hypothetical protein
MDAKETISKEISELYNEGAKLAQDFQKNVKGLNFAYEYQRWYTRALRVVEVLAPDRPEIGDVGVNANRINPSYRLFETFRYPNLYDRLPRHAQAFRFFIQQLNHPNGEIDIYPFLLLAEPSCL